MQFDIKRFQDTFFAEAAEHLASLEANVLRMEAGDCSPEVLDAIFRSAHSIKGGAGTFDFTDVVAFAHAVETLLDKLRAGEAVVSVEITEALLKSTDSLAELLSAARTNRPAPAGSEHVRAALERLIETSAPKPVVVPFANLFRVQLMPHADVFRRGVDPVLMLRTIRDFGVVEESELISNVPRLADYDPETCYLAWALRLRTDKSEQSLLEELAFYSDNVRVVVTRIGEAAPVATPPAKPMSQPPASPPKSIARSQTDTPRTTLPKSHPPSTTFFGTYLIDRRLVRVEDVVEALDRQVASQVVLGRIALETERMKTTQVFEALNWAWEHAVLFGEAAVSLGFLTHEGVRDLIQLQRSRRKPIGAILAEMGVISQEVVEKEYLRFAAERTKGLEQAPPPPEDVDSEPQELGENREMLGDFIAEANEHLEAAEQHLLALESDPSRRDALDAIYRGFHTIKGIASFFNLKDITTLAHAAEDLLNVARDGRIVLTGKPLELSLASVDGLRRQIDLLRDCLAHGGLLRRDPERARLVHALHAAVRDPNKPTSVSALPRTKPPMTRPPFAAPIAAPASIPTPAAPPEAVAKAEPAKADAAPKPEAAGNRPAGDWAEKETVKVDRDRLDKLVNVIGELVIGEAMLGQEFGDLYALTGRESVALPQVQKIVRDLQEMSLSLRMVPVGPTFQKMHRIIRDVGKRLSKDIQFHTQGDETEIDKSVVDQIGDPLMHMIRNAADHGIETPEERIKAGKSPQGHVTLRAFHQGGNIFIELEDDGKGLNRSAILRKAVERGIVAEGATLSDAEICDLIFKPGFSTAKEVTAVSGRGVGMDVVRRNVEAIQGTVSVSSREGVGSIITIRLPLTLAIVDGLMVSVSEQTYVLPLVSVIESFRPRPADVRPVAGRGEVVLVRGEVVPLVRLHHLFGVESRCTDPCTGLVVIVELNSRKTALLVDELQGQSQVVIKNLETNFRKVDGIAGATILGNGQVALILDVHGLARLSASSGEWHSLA